MKIVLSTLNINWWSLFIHDGNHLVLFDAGIFGNDKIDVDLQNALYPGLKFNHRIVSRDQTPGLGFWFYCIRNRSCYSLVCNAQINSMIRSWDWIRPFRDMCKTSSSFELENRRFRECNMIFASMIIFRFGWR